ncbi:MAG: endonuclease/exonuclease/phosphatase family protein [Planctomycetota bacterium]
MFLKLLNIAALISFWPSAAKAQSYDEAPKELKVMTWNVEWMYDDYIGDNRSKVAKENSAPTKQFWDSKLKGVAQVIGGAKPHIVALQEIEGVQTLEAIRLELQKSYGLSYRHAFIQGSDSYLEQDVGILQRNGLVSYRRQEQSKTMYESGEYYNVSKHLIAEFRWSNVKRPLTLMTVHYRARAEQEDLRVKQANLSRVWMETPLQGGHDVIVLGDFNSDHPVGTLKGDIAALAGAKTNYPMYDLLSQLPNPRAPTHLILNKQFDRIMASQSMIQNEAGLDWSFAGIEILDQAVIRGRKDGDEHWDRFKMSVQEIDLSDHHPVVATFRLQ